MRFRGVWAKLFLSLASTVLCVLVLLTGEILCRAFTDTPFLGNSRNLFISGAYGSSKGNARNVRAISFGEAVYTDANGFRYDPALPEAPQDTALLILGDSVAFGGGVEEARTFAGLLRRKLTSMTVFNSSVIGYGVNDYKNVAVAFVPKHLEIRRAYLVFCLNDITSESSEAIDRYLTRTPMQRSVERARNVPLLSWLNDVLRERSKLYLYLKNRLTNPPRRYFLADLARYDLDEAVFQQRLMPLSDIQSDLEGRAIDFTVLVMPYQVQIASKDLSFGVPQKRILEFCRARGIRCLDLLGSFQESGIEPRKLFLPGDPMHLSEAGHRVAFEAILRDMNARKSAIRERPAS